MSSTVEQHKSEDESQNLDPAELLVDTIQKLSEVRTIDQIQSIVRKAARGLVKADGATFILMEGSNCYYVDEDAISPLWKGKRFPLKNCISGWAMINKQQVAIYDIYADERIPHDAYRPTFVKSLVMTPVRKDNPMAAIGTYWANPVEGTEEGRRLLQTLADTTAVALANVELINKLETRVAERTAQLQMVNRELEAFSSRVCHDLKGPLRSIQKLCRMLDVSDTTMTSDALNLIGNEAEHLADLTDSLLELSRISVIPLQMKNMDLSSLANEILKKLGDEEPERNVHFTVAPNLQAMGDEKLIYSLLWNLISNAWKFTANSENANIEIGELDRDKQTMRFFIKDNGIGFNETQADTLFEPFQQLHRGDFPGTGVGLATVKSILSRIGGSISAHSRIGEGATFIVTLRALQ